MRTLPGVLTAVTLAAASGIVLLIAAATIPVHAQSTRKTIYVTARGADGAPLAGLTAGDIVIRERGRVRPIIRVEPSRASLQVAVAVEERLAPDDDVRRAVANFFDHVYQAGTVALYTVGKRSERRIDYTAEIVPFARAINGLPPRSVEPGDIVQAVLEIARDQRSREGRRAIVVLCTDGAQPSTVTVEGVLEQLRAGSSVLYAATLAGWNTSTIPAGSTSGGRKLDLEGQISGLDRDRMYTEGTRQSGGIHVSFQRTGGMFAALERIAEELTRQFVVSYDADPLSDGGIEVEAGRAGLTVRGPTRTK
ncbi:MAG TPA: hypothetical protein VFK57_03975 [Vicinamibacterales bacterium]|nr:hypothetical protein [Vicinamibacterales bacterium]